MGCAKGYLVKILREEGMDAWGVEISDYAMSNAPDEVRVYHKLTNIENEALPFQDNPST
jgi:predicted TPR repeat methyltransferase